MGQLEPESKPGATDPDGAPCFVVWVATTFAVARGGPHARGKERDRTGAEGRKRSRPRGRHGRHPAATVGLKVLTAHAEGLGSQ